MDIRNVAEPAKPVRTALECLADLEALARDMAAHDAYSRTGAGNLRDRARAIVAEMTPPVDPDLVEVDAISAMDTDEGHKILAAIKRGRELERKGK